MKAHQEMQQVDVGEFYTLWKDQEFYGRGPIHI